MEKSVLSPSPGGIDLVLANDDPGAKMDMAKASSSVITLEPYTPPRGKCIERYHQIAPGLYEPSRYEQYLTLDIDDPDVDIFKAHREIKAICGREPKISAQNNRRLIIKTKSPEESQRLQALTSLGGATAQCMPHVSLNYSKGIIYAPQLMVYGECKLQEELADQGVIKVERMKKKINGALTPLPNLILTFNMTRLPSDVVAAWYTY